MMKKLIFIAIVTLMVGCDSTPDPKMTNPVVIDIGTFDDCRVKYIDRGELYNNFYLAKCGNTTTSTQIYSIGKSTAVKTVIVDESSIEDLENKLATLKRKEAALAKLSEEDKVAIGIK